MSEEPRDIVSRFAIIFAIMGACFLLVCIQVVRLQLFDADRWLPYAAKQVSQNHRIEQQRGNIYDVKGRLLVGSLPQYEVYIDTRVPALHEKEGILWQENLDSFCLGLTNVLGLHTAQEYKQVLQCEYKRGNGRYRLCPGRVSYLQMKALKTLPLAKLGRIKSGIWFEKKYVRRQPYENLSLRTIGRIDPETGRGISGLEMYYNSWLAGKPGYSVRQRIAGRTDDVVIEWPEDGYDVVSTLNADMMELVEIALRRRLHKTQSKWGCCVLMDVHSGEVRAISNLKRSSDGEYYEGVNYAALRVEPGSTFKALSLMVAIDDEKASLNDTVRISKRGWQYQDAVHVDAHAMDTSLTLRSAFAVSSNIAFAKLITRCYEGSAYKFVKRLSKTGIMDSLTWEIPGCQTTNIQVPNDVVTLSRMAYGYSLELTPLELLMFYNAVANDGKMVQPIFIKRIEDHGKVLERSDTRVVKSAICKSSTLQDIRLAMHDVVWDDALGTASKTPWSSKKVQSDNVHIAGKTGTAQILTNHKYDPHKHRISFIGYFPEENPQYTCICMMEAPQGAYDSGDDCGGVVKQVAEYVMAYER